MFFGKKSLKEKSPDISRGVSQPLSTPETVPGAALERPAKPKVAVFITHGMGQQLPFETLDAAVEGLAQAAARRGQPVSSIRARMVQIDGVKTQRAEFDMRNARGTDTEVHVYEGYWAPITEGQVSLRDVMWFLLGAGYSGIMNCRLPFERWIFGREVMFGRQIGAALKLLATLGVLLGLVALNAVIAVVGGSRVLQLDGALKLAEPVFAAFTSIAGIYVLACLAFGGALALLLYLKKWNKQPLIRSVWAGATWLAQMLLWAWIVLTIANGLVLLLLAIGYLQPAQFTVPAINRYWLLVWGSLLLVSWYVRRVFVEYLGDVASYIDSHTLDRFNDMRSRIKARVFEQAKAVYADKQYEGIALLGHSLGSVITYDTLNALINHDELNGKTLNVTERTSLLLTFGSPLDKTAFLFASQKEDMTATREALAATLQPLIQTYVPFRDINWINIYSPRDIVSGKLEFYDDPKAADYTASRAIRNVQDADAMIPLAAHIEYWNNTTLFDELYANL